MTVEKIPFLGAHYEARALTANAQQTVNMYPEMNPDGKGKLTLYPFPGLLKKATLGTGPHRGSIEHAGNMYAVSGRELYKVDTSEVVTLIGTLNTGAGKVGMASNGVNLLIVDGTDGYILDGSTLSAITDVDFVDANQCKFLDGYFITNKNATGQFYISDLYPTAANLINGTGWISIDFATAEVDPDNLITHEVQHRELWLFGDYTTEVYYNSGNASFPFDRVSGGFIEWGIAARWSVAKIDNTIAWLAKNKQGHGHVVKATGMSVGVVSNPALEAEIAGYSRIDDAEGFGFQYMGQSFYVLTFPSADVTWALHINSGAWIRLKGYSVGRYIMASHCFFNGKHYIGDYNSGNLYTLDKDTFTNNGETIERIRRTQHISKNGRPVFIHRLEIDVQAGVGLTSGQGSDPQIMTRWSKDGGRTYANAQWRTMGKIGEYDTRVLVNRVGMARAIMFEVVVSDPVFFVIKDAYAYVEMGEM